MQIPQIDAVQEPDSISIYDPSSKHQITDPEVIFTRHVFASGAFWLMQSAFSAAEDTGTQGPKSHSLRLAAQNQVAR